jgi:hypothetical protein
VLSAVDFHDQPGLVADEIGNLATDRYLATELEPVDLTQAQYLSEFPFRLSHILA